MVETATLFGSGWPGRERLPDGTIIEAAPGKPQLRQIGADVTTTPILSLDGPDGYYLVGPEWPPDASWIFVKDSEERLITVAAQCDPNPRVLV